MERREFISGVALSVLAAPRAAEAQTAKVYRVGVVLEGGPYYAYIDGLRAGLKDLGFEEGKQYILHIRDVKGDPSALAGAAKSLEQEKVDVIYTTATSITLAALRSTTKVPIIFNVGSDPVQTGLIKSFGRPGGRLTGIHTRSVDVVAKRLQLLKEAIPKIRRVVTFYQPDNPGARGSVAVARETAPKLRVELVERHVRSVEELTAALRGLKAGEADAIFQVLDAMVNSQSRLVADVAIARKLPTMFNERNGAAEGGLLSYGVNSYTVGRLTAKYVQRVLLGASPAEMPVEGFDKLELVVNLKTAKAIALPIPQAILGRADEVIQ